MDTFAEVIGTLGVILIFAAIVEGIVEAALGMWIDSAQSLKPWKERILKTTAWAVGILGAFIYRFDFIHLAGQWMGVSYAIHPLGMICSGFVIGSGAQAV